MRVGLLATVVAVGLWGWSTMATEPGESTRRWCRQRRISQSGPLCRRSILECRSRAGRRLGVLPARPLHRVRFRADRSSVLLRRADGDRLRLRWQQQIAVVPRTGLPRQFEAPLVFNGWEIPPEIDVSGKVLVALAPPRFVPGPRGYAQTPRPGYAGTLVIDSATGPEPVRWPALFSSVMTPIEVPLPAHSHGDPLRFSFNPVNAEDLFKGSGHTYAEMRALADAGAHLPSFPLAATLSGTMRLDTTDLIAENIIAVLPGVDPTLASECVVVSAHLDGFGVGEPVNGDRIYNGALDDAAYVATLIELADHRSPEDHKILTGE